MSFSGLSLSSAKADDPQLLYASGFLFMGATEEQMQLLNDAGIMHVSYVLILYSIAFILFLCTSNPPHPFLHPLSSRSLMTQ